jgi:hypothetical protein
VSYSTDGGQSWTLVTGTCGDVWYPNTIDKLVKRRADDGQPNYELFLFASDGGLSMDNVAVWVLNSAGSVVGSAPIASVDFNGRQDGTLGLDDAPALDGSVKNIPNLKSRTDGRYGNTPGISLVPPYDNLGW